MPQPIAILYEHPEWFKPLFAELERRGPPYVALHAADHVYDPDERHSPFRLVVNRMSPSAWMRGNDRYVSGPAAISTGSRRRAGLALGAPAGGIRGAGDRTTGS